MPAILKEQQLKVLRSIKEPDQLYELLSSLSVYKLTNPLVIKNYHDLLLFQVAFPANKKIYEIALLELTRISECMKTRSFSSLKASGIVHTEVLCAYSIHITSWLLEKFPSDVSLAVSESSVESARNILQALSPGIEFEKTSQGELSLSSRIKQITRLNHPGAQLKWLVKLFKSSPLPALIKEELFNDLKVFTRWKLDDPFFNRSFLRLPVSELFYQTDFIRNISGSEIVQEKIEKPVYISQAEKRHYADCMKSSLACIQRETDPVTYADETSVELFDLGCGLRIVLIGMIKERRLALESYIGFMAFKNGIAISYGGGWIWGHRCKIGINIFPPFRAAESSWLFCQVMRVYYHRFHVKKFIVKPYQFGKGNPDGLKSGAFWFYYKLGFVPVKAEINELALKEWDHIKEDKNYRTAIPVLKKFTGCNLEWLVNEYPIRDMDASLISASVSNMINTNFNSNRKQAITGCLRKMKKGFNTQSLKRKQFYQQQVMDNWSLMIHLIGDTDKWDSEQKKQLIKLVKLKQAGNERDYILELQKHSRLWESLYHFIVLNEKS